MQVLNGRVSFCISATRPSDHALEGVFRIGALANMYTHPAHDGFKLRKALPRLLAASSF
jgi:hypothetical protein